MIDGTRKSSSFSWRGVTSFTGAFVVVAVFLTVVSFFSFLNLEWQVGSSFRRDLSRDAEHRGEPRALQRAGHGADADVGSSGQPFYDLVIAVLVRGPDTLEGIAEMALVRRTYARYNGIVRHSNTGSAAPWTFRCIFVVQNATTGAGPVPTEGILIGDTFHVDVRPGFAHISDKTLALMSLSAHLDFRFLAKTDSDTFPCLSRIASAVEALPPAEHPRVYAGLLTPCGSIAGEGEKMYDRNFLNATGGVLNCHPMYHQGAFYLLGRDLAMHIHNGRHNYRKMFNEDAMVGLWLLGLRRTLVSIGGSFECACSDEPPARRPDLPLPFYHSCKQSRQMQACEDRLGLC